MKRKDLESKWLGKLGMDFMIQKIMELNSYCELDGIEFNFTEMLNKIKHQYRCRFKGQPLSSNDLSYIFHHKMEDKFVMTILADKYGVDTEVEAPPMFQRTYYK